MINEAIKNNEFNGTFNFKSVTSDYTFDFANSQVVGFERNDDLSSAKCSSSIDVLDCAARSIDSMRTLAWLACMAQIMVCLAIEAGDCLLDGCANLQ